MYGSFNPEIGQLLPAERTALHDTILKIRPARCVEVGTWKGAGSTLQIVSALAINNFGILDTCEPDPEMYRIAYQYYQTEGSQFLDRVNLHNCTSVELFVKLRKSKTSIDFMFADGPEDPELAVSDFLTADSLMKKGSVFAAHDWLNDESIKVSKLKTLLSKRDDWMLYHIVSPPHSVGLAFFQKI